jgi:hypothetical protein
VEIILRGPDLHGAEAHANGMVHELADDPLARALEIAAEFEAKGAEGVAYAKRLTRAALDRPVSEGLADERASFLAVMQTASAREGLSQGRRPARYRSRARSFSGRLRAGDEAGLAWRRRAIGRIALGLGLQVRVQLALGLGPAGLVGGLLLRRAADRRQLGGRLGLVLGAARGALAGGPILRPLAGGQVLGLDVLGELFADHPRAHLLDLADAQGSQAPAGRRPRRIRRFTFRPIDSSTRRTSRFLPSCRVTVSQRFGALRPSLALSSLASIGP